MDRKTLVITPDVALSAAPASLDGLDTEIRPDGSLAISYRFGEVSVAEMIERFHASGAHIADLRTEEADLQDVFLSLTYHREDA